MAKIIALAFLAVIAMAPAAPETGGPAPDFTLRDSAGRERSLSEFKGRIVVLEWFNEGCPFTRKHYASGSMPALQKAATADGVIWLTIVSSAPGKQGHLEGAAAAAKKRELASTALLLDPDGAVGRLYGARTTPEVFIVGGDGRLAYSGAIDDRPTPDPASLAGARNFVRDALAALKAGQPASPAHTKPYGCAIKY